MGGNILLKFVPEVYIIESARMDDYLNGPQEGKALQECLKIMDVPNYYFPVFSKDSLKYVLNQIRPPRNIAEDKEQGTATFTVPILHISAHGAKDFFALTDTTNISWLELRSILAPINKKCNDCLILCMSVCHGFMAYKSAQTMKTSEVPFYQLIGPKESVLWQDSLLAFLIFYRKIELLWQEKTDELRNVINNFMANELFEIIAGETVQQTYYEKIVTLAKDLLQKKLEKKQ